MSSIRYLNFNGKNLDAKLRECRKMFWMDLEDEYLETAKKRMEEILRIDFANGIKAERYERNEEREGYRGGYRYRDLTVWKGRIKRLKVPKGERGYKFWLFEPYKRRTEQLSEAMYRAYIYGMSDRKVSRYFKELYGEEVLTPAGVSYLYKQMSKDVEKWHIREIKDEYRYIYFDAMYQSVRGAIKHQRTILAAYGEKRDGTKEVIDYRVETGESASAWARFIQSLFDRGLKGENLELVIHDGCQGLMEALKWVWPRAKMQLCYIHRMRNLRNRIKNRQVRRRMMREAWRIYYAESRQESYRKMQQLEKRWKYCEPMAIRLFLRDIEKSLTYFDFPKEHWDRIKSTNVLERKIEEWKRRLIPMRCLANPASCDRILYGIIKESSQNQKENTQIRKSEQILT